MTSNLNKNMLINKFLFKSFQLQYFNKVKNIGTYNSCCYELSVSKCCHVKKMKFKNKKQNNNMHLLVACKRDSGFRQTESVKSVPWAETDQAWT